MTPTEDHWAQLSGADLVAELRDAAVFIKTWPDSLYQGAPRALLRAAEVIEAQAQEIERLHFRQEFLRLPLGDDAPTPVVRHGRR